MKHYALERAADPHAYYESAEDVLRDEALTAGEKEHILKSMEVGTAALEGNASRDETAGDGPTGSKAISDALNSLRAGSAGTAAEAEASLLPAAGLFARIVVALNGETLLDQKVVEMARALAAPWQSELCFVIVEEYQEAPALTTGLPAHGVLVTPPVEFAEDMKARLDQRRTETLRLLATCGITAPHLEVRHGQPDVEILKHAEESEANLIVVGSQDQSWFERLVISDPSRRIAAVADCPVLIVPEG